MTVHGTNEYDTIQDRRHRWYDIKSQQLFPKALHEAMELMKRSLDKLRRPSKIVPARYPKITWPPKLPRCAMQSSDSRKPPFWSRSLQQGKYEEEKVKSCGGTGVFIFSGGVRVAKVTWHRIVFVSVSRHEQNITVTWCN